MFMKLLSAILILAFLVSCAPAQNQKSPAAVAQSEVGHKQATENQIQEISL